jgi:phosphopantothenoylcysteine synthetase/decarboxylase
MGTEDNAVTVLDAAGIVAEIDRRPKAEVAGSLLDIIERRLAH